MPKSAVVNLFFEEIAEEMSFKKLSLFFDDIYINDRSFWMWMIGVENTNKSVGTEKFRANVQEVAWLISRGVIKTYSFEEGEFGICEHDNVLAADMREMGKAIKENLIYDESTKPGDIHVITESSKLGYVGVLRASNKMIFNMEDIKMRIDALRLSLTNSTSEFVPILKSFDSYKTKESNDAVLHFVLDKIPTPDVNTSWEQLIDFRSDEDVKRKYYALIDWVNEMSRSNMPITHVADKYNQLYSEYVKQYSLHKLNSCFTTMELLVIGGFEFISSLVLQNYISAFRNMLNIRKQQISLMKAEKEIQGRELAYIFSANQKFSIK